jgi:hypothetical protein
MTFGIAWILALILASLLITIIRDIIPTDYL